jgi:hypothetical protein
MKRFMRGEVRTQGILLPELREDYVADANPVRVVDIFVDELDLFTEAILAIDGAKFKAVNNRDRNFTSAQVQRRMEQIEESIDRYLAALDTADRAEPSVAQAKTARLHDKISMLRQQMRQLRRRDSGL